MRHRTSFTSQLMVAVMSLAVPAALRADHPLPGPHFFDCAVTGTADVILSWDELGLDDQVHRALLYRDGELIADLDPLATDYLDPDVSPGPHAYRIDIVILDEPDAEPVARIRCEIDVPGVLCEVFGGIAVPPQLDIRWTLPAPDASAIHVLRDGEIIATLDGSQEWYSEEPDSEPHEYQVDAVYGEEVVTVGSCLVDYDPPVIGGLQRADCTGDGNHDISDGICILSYLFLGRQIGCLQAADVDDGGTVDLSDAVFLLNHLFLAGAPPAAPYPACGHDTTPDDLGCAEHPPCFNPPPP